MREGPRFHSKLSLQAGQYHRHHRARGYQVIGHPKKASTIASHEPYAFAIVAKRVSTAALYSRLSCPSTFTKSLSPLAPWTS